MTVNNKLAQAPIGIFDSGIGGLSVYQNLHNLLPNERYLYYADTLNIPYGNKKHENIVELTIHAVRWLYKRNCKLIVIACNSASAHGLDIVREIFPNIPVVGLVPALKPAVFASTSKNVAVLATKATLDGILLNDVINHIAKPNGVNVIKFFEPDLVPWVELGMPKKDKTAIKLKRIVENFHQQDVDQIVLGCTHYPFFRSFIESYIGEKQWNMHLVDSGFAIALRVKQLLEQYDILNIQNQISDIKLYASKYDVELIQVLKRLLPIPMEIINH